MDRRQCCRSGKVRFCGAVVFCVKRDAGYACRLPERFPYEKMMQEMEAAGINAITEEVNNQLDQWYNTVR